MRHFTGAVIVVLALGLGLSFSQSIASTTDEIGFEKLEELMMVGAAETDLPEEPGADVLGATEDIIGEDIAEGGPFEVGPEGYVSFDFEDADIRLVLRMFSKRFNVNIVSSPMVEGTVNIRLSNVYWEKALKTIIDMKKYIMQRDDDIIKIITPEEVEQEPLQTRIYTLGYTAADETARVITPLLTDRGHAEVDTLTNKIIISDVPTQFETIETVINELDKQTPQILIEVQILEKEGIAGENIGINWDFMRSYTIGVEDIAAGWTKSDFRTIDSTDKQSIVQSYTSAPGTVDLNKTLKPVTAAFEASKVEKHLGEDASTPEATYRHLIKTATLSAADFDLTFSALIDQGDIEILSQPRLTTVNNKNASIKVAKGFPIPQFTFNADTGRWEVSGFEFKDIGIILNVTPHINKDSYITLDVTPEVSKSDKSIIFGGGGGSTAEIPIIEIRTTTTRVIVRSGETLVIGGLITKDTSESVSKVPLLGDIPLLGALFRHRSTSQKTKDLIIFITPTIVSE